MLAKVLCHIVVFVVLRVAFRNTGACYPTAYWIHHSARKNTMMNKSEGDLSATLFQTVLTDKS